MRAEAGWENVRLGIAIFCGGGDGGDYAGVIRRIHGASLLML